MYGQQNTARYSELPIRTVEVPELLSDLQFEQHVTVLKQWEEVALRKSHGTPAWKQRMQKEWTVYEQ